MITYVSGDLFDSPAKVLVNAVNTVGVMGKGIAKTFKEVYPEMFTKYLELCETGRLRTGKLWLYRTSHKWVLNFPTKEDWRRPSRLEFIEAGLKNFASSYAEHGVSSVAFPRLGCGNGELDWETEVQPLFKKYLAPLAIDIFVHHLERPGEKPEHQEIAAMKEWLRGEPRSLAFSEVWSDLERESAGELVTLDRQTRFRAEVTNGSRPEIRFVLNPDAYKSLFRRAVRAIESFLRFENPDTIVVPMDGFLDLWQSVRASGYLQASAMPGGLDQLSEYIIPLFARLGYFRRVELWTSRSEEKRPALALREPPSGDLADTESAIALRA